MLVNTIHPQPDVDFDFNKPSVCIGDVVTIRDQSNLPTVHSINGTGTLATIAVQPSKTLLILMPIRVLMMLRIISCYGCNSDLMTKSFTVYPFPVVNAGPDKEVLEDLVYCRGTASGNDLEYLWDA